MGLGEMGGHQESEKRCDLRREQKMERERGGGAAVTSAGRLFHRRAAATGNALSPTAADDYVERSETLMRQNGVVVWLQCLPLDVVRQTGALVPNHVDILYRHVSSQNSSQKQTTRTITRRQNERFNYILVVNYYYNSTKLLANKYECTMDQEL